MLSVVYWRFPERAGLSAILLPRFAQDHAQAIGVRGAAPIPNRPTRIAWPIKDSLSLLGKPPTQKLIVLIVLIAVRLFIKYSSH
jgi:hypothetical protein